MATIKGLTLDNFAYFGVFSGLKLEIWDWKSATWVM